MAGSTILNRRQHIGLQKLCALAGVSSTRLGPSKTYTFIQDATTGQSTLVSSCYRILETLELTCAVSQLLYETVEAHHKIYKTGAGCLLFMAGAWSRIALECLHRGIPIAHVMSAMSEGMDICLSVCQQYSIPTEGLHAATSETSNGQVSSRKPIVKDFTTHQQPLNPMTQRKLKLSRHFCELESENVASVPSACLEKPILADIARTLSHGSPEAMNLVIKASQIQSEQDFTFDVTKLLTYLLHGLAEDHSCVLPGCIVRVSPDQAFVAHHLKGRDLKAAFIDGDLTSTYRHLGFNKLKGLQRVSDLPSSETQEEEWLRQVVTILLNMEVEILLLSGVANGKLLLHCWRHNILVVEKVTLSVLKAFATTTGALLVSYATQLNSKCIGTGVTVNVWKELENKGKSNTALNISTSKSNGLVTVVLTSCLQGKLQSLEDQCWACAYRLHWALMDKSLLPGAGVTEMLCVHQLQKQAQLLASGHSVQRIDPRAAAAHYGGVVLHLMADGLLDCVYTVLVNAGKCSKVEARTYVTQQLHDWDGSDNGAKFWSSGEMICDNLIVKQEAWRKALDLVFLVLQTDAEVITGVDQKSIGAQQDLLFL